MIPRLAELILTILVPDEAIRDAIIGDLNEEFSATRIAEGSAAAHRMVWLEIVASSPFLVRALFSTTSFCTGLSLLSRLACRARSLFTEISR